MLLCVCLNKIPIYFMNIATLKTGCSYVTTSCSIFLCHKSPTRSWAGSLLMSLDYTQLETHTHTHTHRHTPQDFCERAISWSPKAITDAAHNKQMTDLPCPQQDSIPRSQQSSGYRATPLAAQPPGSARYSICLLGSRIKLEEF